MKVVKETAPSTPAAGKKSGKSNVILISLIVLLACAFLFCGYKVISILAEYKEAEKMYEGLSNKYVSTGNTTPSTPKPAAPEDEPEEDTRDPEVSPIEIDFATLLEDCPDIVGWLYSPDTVINYPVVQAEDNDKYLYSFIDGTYNGSGTLFFDFVCEPDLSSTNTVLHGHHMNDGSMLASICKYNKQEYYDAHPVMYFNSPICNYRIELFSGYITDPGAISYTVEFGEDYSFQDFIDEVRSLSKFESDVEVSTEDHIITLSTCTYEYNDARFVVHGKLVPIH